MNRSAPRYAASLNDLSFLPPRSYTTAGLTPCADTLRIAMNESVTAVTIAVRIFFIFIFFFCVSLRVYILHIIVYFALSLFMYSQGLWNSFYVRFSCISW